MKLEVIAKGLLDIIFINKTNAARIEYCRKIKTGGLTPRLWKIRIAAKISKIPINVMLRPNDKTFNYSEKEFKKMLKTAKVFEKLNINGVVFGILDKNNEIDLSRMQELIKLMPNKEKTFHKAFDSVSNYQNSLSLLYKLKMTSVLTSANKFNVLNLKELKKIADMKQVTVIAGGGIDFNNYLTVSEVVNEIHVGRCVRYNNSWNRWININKINQLASNLNLITK